ncbi:AtpZ/AtpI family protein [uncultured Tyzzerella sp.]|uniref:AtpZ/AtpI family protein n=1 Tax=uncultured Tyzzerella sp. TaxID=2321398 RepID=UPI0029424953|nr:AtpZ/AtpI family protein [uncultured Tyzzerella sp.]
MKNDFKGYVVYSQFGFVIITSILIGIFLGKKVDGILNTSPIFLLVFIILGMVSSFLNFYFKIMKSFSDNKSVTKNKYIYTANFIIESFSLIMICFIIGNLIDKAYKTNNIFTVLFILISIILNIFIFFKKFNFNYKLTFRRRNNENI